MTARTGTTVTPFLYNGRDGVMTDENGLVYMRARYYSPTLKRFINADVLAGSITNSITLNRYAYANGNPVSNVDPFGLEAQRGGGAIRYNDVLYPIFAPLSNEYYISPVWTTTETLKFSTKDFDWSSFVASISLDDFNGMATSGGNIVNTFSTVLSLIQGLTSSAGNSVTHTNIKFVFQESNGLNRVKILIGNSSIQKIYESGVYPNALTKPVSEEYYNSITHLSEDGIKTPAIRAMFDKRHKDDIYHAYLWLDQNGNLMLNPIVYKDDHIEFGTYLYSHGSPNDQSLYMGYKTTYVIPFDDLSSPSVLSDKAAISTLELACDKYGISLIS